MIPEKALFGLVVSTSSVVCHSTNRHHHYDELRESIESKIMGEEEAFEMWKNNNAWKSYILGPELCMLGGYHRASLVAGAGTARSHLRSSTQVCNLSG